MTIIGYAVTSEFSMQVADRLLSVNRKPHDPNAIKSTILDYEGNLLQIGFSGLAKTGKFDAQRWILDTLFKYKETKKPLVELLDYFAGQADDEFQKINCPDKRFAVVLNGRLLDLEGQDHPDVAIISNGINFNRGDWKPFHEKQFTICSSKGQCKYRRGFIGTLSAVEDNDIEKIESLIDKGAPPEAIKTVMINMIREMSDRKEGNGVIGKDLIWSIITKNSSVKCGFASSTQSEVINTPNRVSIYGSNEIAIKDIKFEFHGTSSVKSKRNDLCWCGSGKKYKKCHLLFG